MSQLTDSMYQDRRAVIRDVTQAQFDAQRGNYQPNVIYRVDGGAMWMPVSGEHVSAVTATRNASGAVVGLSAGGEVITTLLQPGSDINSAINSLPETGGYIKLSPGTFEIIQKLDCGTKSNITIDGSGPSTNLIAADGLNDDMISVGDTDHLVLTTGFTIKNLKISGNKANQTGSISVGTPQQDGPHGIFLHACENVRIENVEITDCYDSGLRHQGLVSGGYSRWIWLINVNSHHNGNWGIELTQRFRQVSLKNVLCDYNAGGGLYADHSEANYSGVFCRHNDGHGIWIHNVQRCSYRGLHSYNNGKLGIYVERMVDSTGIDWFAHNNGKLSVTNPADIYFEAASTAGYGRTRNTTISGIWCGAAENDSTSSENTVHEDYGINFGTGASNLSDLHLLDVHIGETNVAPIRYGHGAMPGVTISAAKRPGKNGPELAYSEETMSRQMVSSAALAPGSGGMRLMYFTAKNFGTYSQVKIPSGSTGSDTPTLVRIGIYSVAADGALTLIASSANDTAIFAAANTVYTVPLSAAVNLYAGRMYALGVLQVATTAAKLVGAVGVAAMNGLNSQLPRVSATLTGLSDLRSSIVDGDLTNQNDRIYAAILP